MNILLVRLRLIGDVIFTTPALRAIKRSVPGARLTYVVEPEAAPVVAGNPHLDRLLVIPRTRGLGRLLNDMAIARTLRASRFDVAIDFHGGPRSAWLTWASGAPKRIGYRLPGRRWVYTDLVDRPRGLAPRHSVVNQWDLLRPLGVAFEPPDPLTDAVEMPEDARTRERVAARLATAGVRPGHHVIVIHVSAGNPFRRWPEESFSDLIATLVEGDSRRRIVLTAGPSDRRAVARIARRARARPNAEPDALVDAGEFDLAELRSLISCAALFIGGDSGPLHIASTTTTPIVGVFGPTLPARSAPWRDPALATESVDVGPLPCRPCDQRHCAPGDYRCLTTLTAHMVAAAAERALARAVRLKPDTTDTGRPDARAVQLTSDTADHPTLDEATLSVRTRLAL